MKVPIAEKTIDRLTNHRSGNKAKMFVSMVLHKHNKHNNGNHSNHHSSNNNTTRATNNLNNNNHINNNVSNLNQAFNSRAVAKDPRNAPELNKSYDIFDRRRPVPVEAFSRYEIHPEVIYEPTTPRSAIPRAPANASW
ncbi:uncharacterized protein LOC143153250 isoform X2 [Ptiloglossa arizonensis]|uniref:uncharacterized protein LOC143153250 isoform X2 n=1 Tax=Ptiloglossa arizonensis TaxID=3350558 RepID=UPI003F9F4D9C